jgi:hypothetical protein
VLALRIDLINVQPDPVDETTGGCAPLHGGGQVAVDQPQLPDWAVRTRTGRTWLSRTRARLGRPPYLGDSETYAFAVGSIPTVDAEKLTERLNANGREATADDQSTIWDGRRLISKADVLAFLKEVDGAGTEGRPPDR